MKIKNKVIAILITITMSSTITYAATNNYYSELLSGQEDQIKTDILNLYNEKEQEAGKRNHNDLVLKVENEKQEIVSEMNKYLEDRIREEANIRLNDSTKEIEAKSEEMKISTKAYIDSLFDN
jgi:hypothetical protein